MKKKTGELFDYKPSGEINGGGTETKKRKASAVRRVISGDILQSSKLQRHYPFILYCCLLIVLYMTFVFDYQRTERNKIERKIELQQVRAKALIYSSKKLDISRYSFICNEIQKRGLDIKESEEPINRIDAR